MLVLIDSNKRGIIRTLLHIGLEMAADQVAIFTTTFNHRSASLSSRQNSEAAESKLEQSLRFWLKSDRDALIGLFAVCVVES